MRAKFVVDNVADGGKFFLIAHKRTFDLVSDEPRNKDIYDNLVSTDIDKKVEAILKYLYGVRNNVFHGGKSLENDDQLEILQPSIRCLQRIITLGMDEVERQSASSSPAKHN